MGEYITGRLRAANHGPLQRERYPQTDRSRKIDVSCGRQVHANPRLHLHVSPRGFLKCRGHRPAPRSRQIHRLSVLRAELSSNSASEQIRSTTLRSIIWFRRASIWPRFSSRARTRRGDSSLWLGDQHDLLVVIRLVRVDFLVFGNPLENEMFLQARFPWPAGCSAESDWHGPESSRC